VQFVDGEDVLIRKRLLPENIDWNDERGGVGFCGQRRTVLVEYEADRRWGSLSPVTGVRAVVRRGSTPTGPRRHRRRV
jgi:hypothetical protein